VSAVETCRRGHPWTKENTIRHASDGRRRCRTCQQAARRKPRTYREKAKYLPVHCPGCGDVRQLSERQARKVRQGAHTGLCETCRFGPQVVVTEELKAWWRKRFTAEEIQVLAAGLIDPTPEHRSDIRERLPKWRVSTAFATGRTAEERMEVAA
jgi:hypothetical protein